MALNSWDVVGDYYTGKLEILKVASRSATVDLNDSTISTTWETFNITSLIGTDVVGVLMNVQIQATDANDDSAILVVREVGDTLAVTADPVRAVRITAEMGVTASILGGWPSVLFPCRGTDPGKLQYAEFSSAHEISNLVMLVTGRIRP